MADKKGSSSEKTLYCSFCGKSQHEVKKLIAGPSVFICDECIDLCNEIIEEELSQNTEVRFDDLPKPREITRMRELLDEILAFHTGQPVERVKKDTDRDFIMSAIDAADYGLVDEVITNRELAAVPSAESTN